MLITFEGLDAAGKDTQTKLAAAYLEKRNLPYRLLSFPTYDGRMSALVQMYLRGEFGSDPKAVNAYARFLLLCDGPLRVLYDRLEKGL